MAKYIEKIHTCSGCQTTEIASDTFNRPYLTHVILSATPQIRNIQKLHADTAAVANTLQVSAKIKLVVSKTEQHCIRQETSEISILGCCIPCRLENSSKLDINNTAYQ